MNTHLAVLLIEDNLSVQLTTTALLEDAGYSVSVAGSLAQARRCLAERRFDIFLVDLQLPDGSGSELIPEIRARVLGATIALFSGTKGVSCPGVNLVLDKAGNPELMLADLARARPPRKA